MSDNQQFHAKRIAPLPEMEARFNEARVFILQHHPDEQIGDFVPMEGLEAMHHDDLEVLKVRIEWLVKGVERRAAEVQAEVAEAARARAERERQQNMTPLEARIEKIERALAYQGAEIAKLNGTQHGRLPALPHVARAEVPQFLGMPAGVGRHGVVGLGGGSGGVRKLAAGTAPAADTPFESGVTRRQHPLDVIGSSGRRG
jgi:hypothetical protein